MEKGYSLTLATTSKDNSRSNHNDNDISVGKNRPNCGKLGQNCGKVCRKSCVETSQARIEHADNLADWLVDQLKAPHCRPYFCKCAYHLSYEQIASAVVMATMPTVKSPVKYFNAVTKRLMIKQVA